MYKKKQYITVLALFIGGVGCQADKMQIQPQDTGAGSETETETESERLVFVHAELILNRSGRLFMTDGLTGEEIWSLQNPDDPVWSDARSGLEHNTIWHNVVDVKNHDPNLSEFREIDKSGNILSRISVPGAHHSFDLLPNGDIVAIVTKFRENPTHGRIAGDEVVRISNGQQETILSAFDVLFPQPLTDMWNHGQFENAKDWTHANCIRYHEPSDSLLLTVPGVNALWKFDVNGGITAVYLGADMSEEPYRNGPLYQTNPFPIYGGGQFELPHGATQDDQGRLWVMSTGVGGQSTSYADGYSLSNGELVLERRIETEEGAHSAGLGGVFYTPQDDSLLINWGIFGRIEKLDADDKRQWQINSPIQRVYAISTKIIEPNLFLGD